LNFPTGLQKRIVTGQKGTRKKMTNKESTPLKEVPVYSQTSTPFQEGTVWTVQEVSVKQARFERSTGQNKWTVQEVSVYSQTSTLRRKHWSKQMDGSRSLF